MKELAEDEEYVEFIVEEKYETVKLSDCRHFTRKLGYNCFIVAPMSNWGEVLHLGLHQTKEEAELVGATAMKVRFPDCIAYFDENGNLI